jgi:hypothetical protein
MSQDAPLTLAQAINEGRITHVPYPDGPLHKLQCYNCAGFGTLRSAGNEQSFLNLGRSVSEPINHLATDR